MNGSGARFFIGFCLISTSALVFAQTGVVEPNGTQEVWWVPLIRTVVEAVITVMIAWAAKRFHDKTGIDIEATHRNALHSAAMTGVNAALAKGQTIDLSPRSPIIGEALRWVEKSVPDALKYLKLDDEKGREKLRELIESKLTARLDASNPADVERHQSPAKLAAAH